MSDTLPGEMAVSTTKTSKAEKTRAKILDTALALFRAHGYDRTTMRAVATTAGVSLGNAYYYFKSKESLIQGFYGRTHEEHLAACGPLLEQESGFRERLMLVMRAKLETIGPYHRFAQVLFKTAADPKSPLNPFSDESKPVRREAIELFERVLVGSNVKVGKKLAAELPELLWTYHMGIILYWIHDESEGAAKTEKLVEETVDLIVKLVSLSRLPPLRPVVTRTLRMMAEFRGPGGSVGQEPEAD